MFILLKIFMKLFLVRLYPPQNTRNTLFHFFFFFALFVLFDVIRRDPMGVEAAKAGSLSRANFIVTCYVLVNK